MDEWEQPREAQRVRPAVAAAVVAALIVAGAVLSNWEGPWSDWDGPGPIDEEHPDALTIETGVAPPDELDGSGEVFDEADGSGEGSDEADGAGAGSGEPEPSRTAAGRWEPMADSPLSARVEAAAVWTGEHVLFWGGFVEERFSETAGDGSNVSGARFVPSVDGGLYDPAADSWRRIPDAPLPAEGEGPVRYVTVWTGEELVAMGDHGLAAYAPDRDQWREVPEPPEGDWRWDSAVWTEQTVVLLAPRDHEPRAVAYLPDADRWEELPPPPILDVRTASLNGRAVVYGQWTSEQGTSNAITAYDPVTRRWSEPDPIPVEAALGNALREVAADPVRDRVVLVGASRDRDAGHGDGWRPLLASWRPAEGAGWRGLPRSGPTQEVVANPEAARQGTILSLPPPAGVRLLFSYQGWQQLPDPNEVPRHGSSVVWTGEELIVWGGRSPRGVEAEGNRWRLRQSAPIATLPHGSSARGEWPFTATPD